MRTLYGRTNMNPVSRFIGEIPEGLLENVETENRRSVSPGFSRMGRQQQKPVYDQHLQQATGRMQLGKSETKRSIRSGVQEQLSVSKGKMTASN